MGKVTVNIKWPSPAINWCVENIAPVTPDFADGFERHGNGWSVKMEKDPFWTGLDAVTSGGRPAGEIRVIAGTSSHWAVTFDDGKNATMFILSGFGYG